DVPAGHGHGGRCAAEQVVAVHGGQCLALPGPERDVVVGPQDGPYLVVPAGRRARRGGSADVGAGEQRRGGVVGDVGDRHVGDVVVAVVVGGGGDAQGRGGQAAQAGEVGVPVRLVDGAEPLADGLIPVEAVGLRRQPVHVAAD